MKKLFAAIVAVSMLAFAVPAMAAHTTEMRVQELEQEFMTSMKFYGSSRMTTFYYKDAVEATPGNFSETNLQHTLQGNSRIGGRIQAGDVRGHFEYGHGGGNVGLRHLYGEWDFGPGKLLVGQTETPTSYIIAGQVGGRGGDQLFLGWGNRYIGRRPMVQLSMGDFKVAAVENQGSVANVIAAGPNDRNEIKLPQLQASYTVRAGAVDANIAGAWQTFKIFDQFAAAQQTHSVDSYMLALGARYNIGPARFFGDVYFGDNVGHLGNANVQRARLPGAPGPGRLDWAVFDGIQVQDSETFAWMLGINYHVNDMIAFGAGYTERSDKIEYTNVRERTKMKSYYLNMPITLAKGVWIIPEVGKMDWGSWESLGVPDQDLGDTKYFGAKWQINF